MSVHESPIEVSAEALASSVGDVLERVKRERVSFVVTEGGRSVATIVPAALAGAGGRSAVTLAELVERLGSAPRPDPAFADDLEQIHASQPPLTEVPWDS